MLKHCLPFLITIIFCQPLMAETVYITDTFEAPLRSGATTAYRIKALLKSGTSLNLLETDIESGYSKVITKKGTEGWILTSNLIDTPIARNKITAIEKKITTLLQQRINNKATIAELKTAGTDLQNDNQALNKSNNKLTDELTHIKNISSHSININQRNKTLTETNQHLQNQLDLLSAENARLKTNTNNDFFLYGAGTITIGLLIGLLIPALRPKRKDPGWV